MSLLVATLAAPAAAQPDRKSIGAAVAPITLVPTGDHATSVGGLASYFGEIRLDSASDGIVVVDRLSLERYLLGLNEVPRDWPPEALRAQAIAARTYALYTLAQPRAGAAAEYGFDICASIQCQVFSGADVVAAPDGERWLDAVRDTAGEVVTFEGRPILSRYHSTSGGMTLDNADAFEGEPDYPYLRSVPSTTEGDSPLYRWTVEFRLRHLESILRRAGWWSDGRLRVVRTIPSRSGKVYPDVRLRGGGAVLVRSAQEFREAVRELAPAMFPLRYPSFALTSSGRLPETLPSNRVDIATKRGLVVVDGRGWGHGTGMSQWGAHGMAELGASYREILGHYYTNTEVETLTGPGSIDVGVGWGMDRVSASGAFRIVDGRGRTLVRSALGTWTFTEAGDGALAIRPPRGYGLPLRVGIVDAPQAVDAGEPAVLTVALSRPAEVTTLTEGEASDDVGGRVRDAGRRRVVWRAPLEPGHYRVRVHAAAGAAQRSSEPVEVVVVDPDAEPRPPAASEPSDGGLPVVAIVAGILVLCALGAAAATVTIGR